MITDYQNSMTEPCQTYKNDHECSNAKKDIKTKTRNQKALNQTTKSKNNPQNNELNKEERFKDMMLMMVMQKQLKSNVGTFHHQHNQLHEI